MSLVTPPSSKMVRLPPEPVRRLTVDEYHQMIEAGILKEDDPFELLEGWLVPKMTRKPPHGAAVSFAEEEVGRRLPAGWCRRIQAAITAADSEPEPDLSVVRGRKRDYVHRHPGARDTALVVEVADTTLTRDRTTKARLYARARIPVYWIINLIDGRVEVYTDPAGSGQRARYRQRRDYASGEAVPLVVAGRDIDSIPVLDLLP
ncbi:MAG TPA: Uma2 family endonuclease [Gemmataceae bacterium]|nr:Uma2 family endonuclease [Gemmataceae bacterium]